MAGKIIYFVRSERSGLIKIGITNYDHPRQRYEDLCRESEERLGQLGITYGDHKAEAAIHARFSDLRVKGEWFRAESPLLDFIRDHLEPWPPRLKRRRRFAVMAGQQAAHRKSYRWTDEDMETFRKLGEAWGGIRPLPETAVIREAVRRCLAAAKKSDKKSDKKSSSVS